MHKKAIFFDLYQTLINVDIKQEKKGKEAGFNQIIIPYLLQKGASESEASSVLLHYSDELTDFYRDHDIELFQHSFPAILSKVFSQYYSLIISEFEMGELLYEFRKVSRGYLALYEGVREILETLSAQYTLAVASHTQSIYTERELKELNISRHFRHRIYSSDIGFKKSRTSFIRSVWKLSV